MRLRKKEKKWRFGNFITHGQCSENGVVLYFGVKEHDVSWMPSFYDSQFVAFRIVRSLK